MQRKQEKNKQTKAIENYHAKLTDFERGYFAGFLDGEGSIGLGKHRKFTKCRPFTWETFGGIYNSNKESIAYIKQLIRKISPTKKASIQVATKGRKQPIYCLRFCAETMRAIIPEIGSCLIVKREQAKLLGEALPLIKSNHYSWKQKNDDKLEEIYQKLRMLNLGSKLGTAIIPEKTEEQKSSSQNYHRVPNQFGIPTNTREGKRLYSLAWYYNKGRGQKRKKVQHSVP